jgi:hypothetical protein
MRPIILCVALALVGCGRPSYVVLAVDSNQLHTGLNALKAVVTLDGERADLDVIKGSSYELAPGRPLSFAIKFGPDKSGTAKIELTARRDLQRVLQRSIEVTLVPGDSVNQQVTLQPFICGELDQPCCADSACAAGLVCDPGDTCRPCGVAGQLCCAGSECASGSVCAAGGSQCSTCGGADQPCCPGSTCGSKLVCDAGICRCGGQNQPCCAGASGCGSNLVCKGDLCECGAPAQPCCSGNSCATGNTCMGGTHCVPCGQQGEPCCGTTCGANLTCDAGMCKCGASGQLCCGGTSCDVSFSCQSGTCQSCLPACANCGANTQPCCAGNSCSVNHLCNIGLNQCQPCGGVNQQCCAGNSCGSNLSCVSGTCRCGSQGQPCCSGTACNTNLTCNGGSCKCGAQNQPCCGGTTCNASLMCLGGTTCVCGAAGQPCCGGSSCNSGNTCQSQFCVPCGGLGQPCCSGACDTGLGCASNRCAVFGGAWMTQDQPSTCATCPDGNTFTSTCGCPGTSFTGTATRALNDCRGAGTYHGVNPHFCQSASLIAGSDFGGVYQLDDLPCRAPAENGCAVKNKFTNACSCPTGYSSTSIYTLVDVAPACSSLGMIGTRIHVCVANAGTIVNFGGAYQVNDAACMGHPTCNAGNPRAGGACGCPTNMRAVPIAHIFANCDNFTRAPSTVYVCMP